MKKFGVLMIGLILIANFNACDKKTLCDFENQPIQSQVPDYKIETIGSYPEQYYIDNKLVDEKLFNEYQLKHEDFLVIVTGKIDDPTGDTLLLNYGFTTEAGYVEYGEKNNLKLKEELQFTKHMREYAEETGAILEYDNTGKIPESYLAYETEYYKKVFAYIPGNKQAFVLYDNRDYSGEILGVPYFWMLASLYSWKNRVSAVFDWGPGGVITFYDNTFFRTYLVTFVSTPIFHSMRMPPFADNKTESVVTY